MPTATLLTYISKKINGPYSIQLWSVLFFIAALSIRIGYYSETINTPIDFAHKWQEADMNFFDYWATQIAEDDWLNEKAPHPYHAWHKTLAEMHFNANKADSALYAQKSADLIASDSTMVPGKVLMYDWYGGKTFHQEPLYVYMVALTYKLFGHDVRHVFLWQILLGALSIVLIFLISKQLGGLAAGIISAVIALLCGPMLFFDLVLLRTCLSGFLTLAMLYSLILAADSQRVRYYTVFGLFSGFAMLNYSYYLLFSLAGILWILFNAHKKNTFRYTRIIWFLFGILIPLLPLIFRNILVGIHPLALASNAGITFITANAKITDPQASFFIHFDTLYAIMSKTGGAAFQTILETIQTHDNLGSFILLLWKKWTTIFMQFEIPNNINYYFIERYSNILDALPVDQRLLGTLGLVGGLYFMYTCKEKSIPIIIATGICLFPMLYFSALSRHRMPLLGIEAIVVGWFLVYLFRILTEISILKSSLCMGAILAAFFWVKQNDLEKRTKYDFIDYNFAYMEKYEPLLIDAEKTNNWKRFLELTQELIQVQPEYIEQSFKKFKLLDYKQAEIMEFYANMYRMHAAALEKNGRNGEGTLFLERSQILSKLASESKTKFKVMQPTH